MYREGARERRAVLKVGVGRVPAKCRCKNGEKVLRDALLGLIIISLIVIVVIIIVAVICFHYHDEKRKE